MFKYSGNYHGVPGVVIVIGTADTEVQVTCNHCVIQSFQLLCREYLFYTYSKLSKIDQYFLTNVTN